MIMIILLIVLAVLSGCWYAYRTYKLVADTPEDEPVLAQMPDEAGNVPDEVLKNLAAKLTENMAVKPMFTISVDAAPALTVLGKAMGELSKIISNVGSQFEIVLDTKHWQWYKPYFNKHDIYFGAYWKIEDIEDVDTIGDILTIYLVIPFIVLLKLQRTRTYKAVPKIDKRIDPVCLLCGFPHSEHMPLIGSLSIDNTLPPPAYPLHKGMPCEGKFIT